MSPEPALDRERFSRIAHGELPLWNPVGLDVLDAWIAGLAGHGVRRALDVGCGRGELLVRLALAHATAGLGIDPVSLGFGLYLWRVPEVRVETSSS